MISNNTSISASEEELRRVLRELHKARMSASDVTCLTWFVANNDENTVEKDSSGGGGYRYSDYRGSITRLFFNS